MQRSDEAVTRLLTYHRREKMLLFFNFLKIIILFLLNKHKDLKFSEIFILLSFFTFGDIKQNVI